MRQTSIEAFNAIRENGLLTGLQFEIYSILFDHGPMTAGEAAQVYRSRHPQTNRQRNEIAKRVSDLRAVGVVREIGARPCKASGMRVLVWDVTDRLPERESVRPTACPTCGGCGYLKPEGEQVGFSFTGVEA